MKPFTNNCLIALVAMSALLIGCHKEPAPAQPQQETAVAQEEVTPVETPQTPSQQPVQKPTQTQPAKPLSTAATPVKDYAACFAQWDEKMTTLQTDFIQTAEYDGLPISTSNGRIYYQREGTLLRLDSLEDSVVTQTALTDKKQIYIQDEKGKEIAKVAWKEWLQGQPNQALFDFGNYRQLLQKHNVDTTQTTASEVTLRLQPKNESDEYVLYVTLHHATCFPQTIKIESDLMVTTATLDNAKLNGTLPQDIFKGLK